ncbi:MAG: hypothetical protein U0L92_06370 [Clostridia bacterium]|nr:hypothetical protein [Clostridia bacterium]
MGEEAVQAYNQKTLLMLQREVKQMEDKTLDAIEDLEARLSGLCDVIPAAEDENWSPRLDTVEIYTMEELPPLKESIRQICSGLA